MFTEKFLKSAKELDRQKKIMYGDFDAICNIKKRELDKAQK